MKPVGREEWIKVIEQFTASGKTQREFAEENGVSLGTLQFWIYKLRRETKTPRFVPVHVVASAPAARDIERGFIELVTRGGHVLRFAGEIDPRYIASILAELG